MKTIIKKLPKSRVKLTIELSKEEMVKYFDKAFEVLAPTVVVKGFRAGKAPRAMIEQSLGEARLKSEAVDSAMNEAYVNALKENNLVPAQAPQLVIQSAENGLKFEIEVDVWPQAEIGDYKKLKVKVPSKEEVKEEEIDKIIEYLQRQKADMKEIDREAKKGDWAAIDFQGKFNGVLREDMVSKFHPVILGSGNLIPGFEDEIEGMKKGEDKTFKLNFPKDYHEKTLVGKQAEFTVSLKELKEVTLPEVNDQFVKDFGHKDVKDMRKAIAENLEKEKEEDRNRQIESMVLEKVLGITKADVPQSMVEQEIDRIFHRMEHEAQRYSLTLDQYILRMKKTREELQREFIPQGEKNVKIGLIMGEVAKREGLNLEDKEVAQKSVEKLVEILTK